MSSADAPDDRLIPGPESTGPESTGPEDSRGSATGIGPLVLLLPLLSLILGVLWARWWRMMPSGERAEPPPAVALGGVEGWAGSIDGPAGERIVARLVPLHRKAERQANDARALARRLGIESAGEPWQLTVACLPGTGPGVELADLAVRDDDGRVLRPVTHSGRRTADRDGALPADPLVTLLEPPGGVLEPGREVSVVLWGPRPAGSARLEGRFGSLALRAQEIDVAVLARSLARLDRPFETNHAGERR